MELWIYIVPIDWPNEVNNFPTFGAPPLDGIVRDLESDGFEAIATTIGKLCRTDNIYVDHVVARLLVAGDIVVGTRRMPISILLQHYLIQCSLAVMGPVDGVTSSDANKIAAINMG